MKDLQRALRMKVGSQEAQPKPAAAVAAPANGLAAAVVK